MERRNMPHGQDRLPEAIARSIFRDLIFGLEYLHGNGILHRDLKPENLVYTERPPYGEGNHRPSVSFAAANTIRRFSREATEVGREVGPAAESKPRINELRARAVHRGPPCRSCSPRSLPTAS
eukprot:3974153-Prymnesium_polylepis.1